MQWLHAALLFSCMITSVIISVNLRITYAKWHFHECIAQYCLIHALRLPACRAGKNASNCNKTNVRILYYLLFTHEIIIGCVHWSPPSLPFLFVGSKLQWQEASKDIENHHWSFVVLMSPIYCGALRGSECKKLSKLHTSHLLKSFTYLIWYEDCKVDFGGCVIVF